MLRAKIVKRAWPAILLLAGYLLLPAQAATSFAAPLSLPQSPLQTRPWHISGTGGKPAVAGYPNSIASTGDSITRAYNTGSLPYTDAPANSWSTGTNSSVLSHYSRILAANPAISGRNYNEAVSGAKMVNLEAQASAVNTRGVQYVTVLMGANDVCASSEAAMTTVATFRAQFRSGLAALSAGSPDARIYVMSVPDVYMLWSILKDNSLARAAWSTFSICQSMLANPLSTAPEDAARRARVRQRVIDYNNELAKACAEYVHCRFDDGAVFATPFTPDDVSTRDYFHPSIAGQAKLALTTYSAGYNFSDAVPPTSGAVLSLGPRQGFIASLWATDNVKVAGIEYKVGSGPYALYTTPVQVQSGSTLTYRAVDINGNTEAAHVVSAP